MSDLSVGSFALHDPPGSTHGAHVTFSAKQELSGWQEPSEGNEEEAPSPFTASGTRPRLFVVFEDGSGYEVLDKDLYTAYAQRQVSRQCVSLHSFLAIATSAMQRCFTCLQWQGSMQCKLFSAVLL